MDDAVDGPVGDRSGLTTWQDIVETGSWYAQRAAGSAEKADDNPASEPAPQPEPSFAAEANPQPETDGVRLARQWAREMSSETGTIPSMQQQPLSSSPSLSVPRSSGYAGSRAQAFQAAVRATRSERRPGLGGVGAGRSGSGGRGSRQAHLTLARVEPWSVLKFSSVAAVVAFVILFVAVLFLYIVLDGMGVFSSLQNTTSSVTSSQSNSGTNISGWFSASTILGYTALLGVINIVLIPALCTVGAVIYNLIADFFGGIEVTLRESD